MTSLPKPLKALTHFEVEAILLGIDLDYTMRRVALRSESGTITPVRSAAGSDFCLPIMGSGCESLPHSEQVRQTHDLSPL